MSKRITQIWNARPDASIPNLARYPTTIHDGNHSPAFADEDHSANAGIHLGRRCQDVLQRIQIAPSGLAQIQMEENEVSSHGPRPPHEEPEAKRRRLQEDPKVWSTAVPMEGPPAEPIREPPAPMKGLLIYQATKACSIQVAALSVKIPWSLRQSPSMPGVRVCAERIDISCKRLNVVSST